MAQPPPALPNSVFLVPVLHCPCERFYSACAQVTLAHSVVLRLDASAARPFLPHCPCHCDSLWLNAHSRRSAQFGTVQDFARNQVGAQLNTLASSVLTLEPESDDPANHQPHHKRHAAGHAADQWAAPNNGRDAGFEGCDSEAPAGPRGGRGEPSDEHHPHLANGSSGGGAGDFQDVPLDDNPPEAAAKPPAPPGKGGGGGAAVLAALREENAGLKQRLAAVEAVSVTSCCDEGPPLEGSMGCLASHMVCSAACSKLPLPDAARRNGIRHPRCSWALYMCEVRQV